MTNAEIATALSSPNLVAARAHISQRRHPSDCDRRFFRIPLTFGELRYEDRDGWIMDTFSICGHTFRPVELDETTREMLWDVMIEANDLVASGAVKIVFDMDAAEGDSFVVDGAPNRVL